MGDGLLSGSSHRVHEERMSERWWWWTSWWWWSSSSSGVQVQRHAVVIMPDQVQFQASAGVRSVCPSVISRVGRRTTVLWRRVPLAQPVDLDEKYCGGGRAGQVGSGQDRTGQRSAVAAPTRERWKHKGLLASCSVVAIRNNRPSGRRRTTPTCEPCALMLQPQSRSIDQCAATGRRPCRSVW